jgi:sulfur-carrier protein adenylyltransferase/sulfurtransferase
MVASHDADSAGRPLPALTVEERSRYGRHLTLPSVGVDGQRRLKAARVLIVGAGGLGSPSALYLAAAGVGTLGLVDNDIVDVSNLQRQLLHGTRDVGRAKLDSARDRLVDVNPLIQVVTHAAWLTSVNAMEIIAQYDVVIDGTDNFATRFLVNDACVLLGKPNVHGAIFQFDGQASVFATAHGPCYRCLYPTPPPPSSVPNCAEGGVFGALPGLIGTIQAIETLKLILHVGESLAGRLMMIDTLTMRTHTVQIARDPSCPACGTRELTALIDYDEFCGVNAATGDRMTAVHEITPTRLAERLARGDDVDLIDVREPFEVEIASLPAARLIPLGTIPAMLDSLQRDRDIVVMCRSGGRSAEAARLLQAAGFSRVSSLSGGLLRWSDEVDASVPRY